MTDTEPDPARVLLDGALTVRAITGIRTSLLEALADHQTVLVDCGSAESADLSLVQLLLAARLSAQRAGKRLLLAAPAAGALRVALEQGGFLPSSGADPFWSGDA